MGIHCPCRECCTHPVYPSPRYVRRFYTIMVPETWNESRNPVGAGDGQSPGMGWDSSTKHLVSHGHIISCAPTLGIERRECLWRGHLLASSGEGVMRCKVPQRSGGPGGPMRRRTTGNVLRRQFCVWGCRPWYRVRSADTRPVQWWQGDK